MDWKMIIIFLQKQEGIKTSLSGINYFKLQKKIYINDNKVENPCINDIKNILYKILINNYWII